MVLLTGVVVPIFLHMAWHHGIDVDICPCGPARLVVDLCLAPNVSQVCSLCLGPFWVLGCCLRCWRPQHGSCCQGPCGVRLGLQVLVLVITCLQQEGMVPGREALPLSSPGGHRWGPGVYRIHKMVAQAPGNRPGVQRPIWGSQHAAPAMWVVKQPAMWLSPKQKAGSLLVWLTVQFAPNASSYM